MKLSRTQAVSLLTALGHPAKAVAALKNPALAAKLADYEGGGKKVNDPAMAKLKKQLLTALEEEETVEVLADEQFKLQGGAKGANKKAKPPADDEDDDTDTDEEEDGDVEDDEPEEEEDGDEEEVEDDTDEGEEAEEDEPEDDEDGVSDEDDEDLEDEEVEDDEDGDIDDEESDDDDDTDSEEDSDEEEDDTPDEEDDEMDEAPVVTKKPAGKKTPAKPAAKPAANGKGGGKTAVKNVKPSGNGKPAVKKAGGEGKPGVIASIQEFLEAAGRDKKQLSKEALVKMLKKRFPEREESALKGTVAQQVPGKLRNEKGLNVQKGEKGYWIAGGKAKK